MWVCESGTDLDLAAVRARLYQHGIVILRGSHYGPQELLRLATLFGRLVPYLQEHYRHPEFPEIFVSRGGAAGSAGVGVPRTGQFWHSDTSFYENPALLTLIAPQVVHDSDRRETWFVNLADVFDVLPANLKRPLEAGVFFRHSGRMRYKLRPEDVGYDITEVLSKVDRACPPVQHPALVSHPVTGRRGIYGSEAFVIGMHGAEQLVEWDVQGYLRTLFSFAKQERFVEKVPWHVGDVVIWDNRFLMHRSGVGEDLSSETMMYRISIDDGLGVGTYA